MKRICYNCVNVNDRLKISRKKRTWTKYCYYCKRNTDSTFKYKDFNPFIRDYFQLINQEKLRDDKNGKKE